MAQTLPQRPPLVGREEQLSALRKILDRAGSGEPRPTFVRGESGVGKSRLVAALARDAARQSWQVFAGRGYPLESGQPFALFADAFVPFLRSMDGSELSELMRGSEGELSYLFPQLWPATTDEDPADPEGRQDVKTRVFWNFTAMLRGLAERQPLLLLLEDLHWADESSLELLHFLARRTADVPLLVVGTYTDDHRRENRPLMTIEQSLAGLGRIDLMRLSPLTQDGTLHLVAETFDVAQDVCRDFCVSLHRWTRGNPFLVVESLAALVEAGRLKNREGTWVGWQLHELELPQSIRDVVRERMNHVSADAVQAATVVAVIGGRVPYPVLRSAAAMGEASLLAALDELRHRHLLDEGEEEGTVYFSFVQPLVREVFYAELGRARSRMLHGTVALALEAHYGEAAVDHADELAYHFARADPGRAAFKAVGYLAHAGRQAFRQFAYGRAAQHLDLALVLLGQLPDEQETRLRTQVGTLEEDLAWAKHALGDSAAAVVLLQEARARATEANDERRLAEVLRRLAHVDFWGGRYQEALRRIDEALIVAERLDERRATASLLLLRGLTFQHIGEPDPARDALERALQSASTDDDATSLAKVHRALALLHLWTGDPAKVRIHGERAVELAERSGSGSVLFWSHHLMAVLEGLTGNAGAMPPLIEEVRRIASDLRSPALRLWAAELSVELASAMGDWDRGIALGEQAIELARSLEQTALLPRLLVWTALIHIGRGDLERAGELIEEASARSGSADVHAVLPVHTGRAALELARGNHSEAIRIGLEGVAIADRSGYFVWGIHRLLPIVVEAYLLERDLDGARAMAARLRRDASRIGHRLGLAWAEAAEAIVTWLAGDPREGARRLRSAADSLEAVPFPWDAARLRRQLAGRLADLGHIEEARKELRRVHKTFAQIGAERELDKTRDMFREVGSRPPPRSPGTGAGTGALTAREVDIARLVADGNSNKAIAKTLGISPRTVSTHVSSIFKKVGVGSRGELAERVRTTTLPDT